MPFKDPITSGETLNRTGLRSEDYVEAQEGWRIGKDGSAQFEELQVLHGVNAESVNANGIVWGGIPLEDFFTPLPLGGKAFAAINSANHMGNIKGTELALIKMAFGPVVTGRLYRISVKSHIQYSAPDEHYDFRLRYTAGNTNTQPSLASATIVGSVQRVAAPGGSGSVSKQETLVAYYAPAGNWDQVICLLTGQRVIGSGYAFIYQIGNTDRRQEWLVEDLGIYGDIASGAALSQISTTGGSTYEVVTPPPAPPPDPDPIQRYTTDYYATWSRSFDEDNGTRQGDDTNDMYQGEYSSTHGRTFSLAGFDYAKIMSNLSGATIISCHLTYKVKWIAGYGGLRVRFNTHDYTTKPSSVSQARVNTDVIAAQTGRAAGSTYKVSLGSGIGNQFKSGAIKGIGFGPAGTQDEYGRMYGETDANRPKLTIVYDK